MDRAENIRRLKENAGKPKDKKPYQIPKISAKRQAKRLEDKGGKEELWEWFLDQRKLMTGICQHCGGVTEKKNDNTFHFSIAHILPKKLFPSVATHLLNRIELCYYGNSCHTNFDNYFLDMTDLNCWDTVVERFVAMYPEIAVSERRLIPEVLRQFVNIDV